MLPTMLFLRDFTAFRGGSLKVFDYFNHAAASQRIRPLIYMTDRTGRESTNPWVSAGILGIPKITAADSYFVAGLDWGFLDEAGIDVTSKPVINLIQGFGYADPENIQYQYLLRKALRICVGPEIADAVRKTGRVNGELVCIPNCTDLSALSDYLVTEKRRDVFIAGFKNPPMAEQIGQALLGRGLDIDTSFQLIPRKDFLTRMAAARIALLLPQKVEAFPLFALEAMALKSAVVIPDCVGNRSYCRNDETCVVAQYDQASLARAAIELLADPGRQKRLVDAALLTAQAHSLDRERSQFYSILDTFLSI
jgi:hypothetical protein